VSGGHAHDVEPGRLLDGPIERLAPQVKIVGTVAFVLAVVVTPATAVAAFFVDGLIVVTLLVVALVPARTIVRRLVFELPFVALAVSLVLLGGGPATAVGPIELSTAGLWSAWAVVSRATLGLLAASLLAATTSPDALLTGLERLRLPSALRAIAAMGVRYLEVLRLELERMRLAQELRSPLRRRLAPREVAGVGAALFVRTYERGERVQLATATRRPKREASPGVPASVTAGGRAASLGEWVVALLPAAVAVVLALTAAAFHLVGRS
jgi:cobalt/nickel transport system permease protein